MSGPDHRQATPVGGEERFRCGTLLYTRASLFVLFSWLLWGDFCFSLMENIWPNVLPFILKAEGAPNLLLSLLVTTIPNAMNFVLNPIISTASDRYRSPRGRRIPFLMVATPFVTVFLVLIGFSRDLGKVVHGLADGFFPSLGPASVTIFLIGVLVVGFRFFELFINTVFWYLFNDVVPAAFLGRFMAYFRVAGSLAGAVFNFLLLPYADSHATALFCVVGVLYGIAFFSMTVKVREGEYPPPEPVRESPLGWIRVFLSECLQHRVFRRIFLFNAFVGAGNAAATFTIFTALSIGLDLGETGRIMGVALVAGTLLMIPMGSLVDRWHPIRVALAARIGLCLVVSVQFVFLFHEFSRSASFWIYAAVTALAIPLTTANTIAALPLAMRLFPQDKFGQFCAAHAMCSALGTMIGSLAAGFLLDLVRPLGNGPDYCYRFVPVWTVFFTLVSVLALVRVYREWKRLGGDSGYVPPTTNPVI